MIRFSTSIDVTMLTPLVERKLEEAFDRGIRREELTNELYVFGVVPRRDADVYISSAFDERLLEFIETQTGWTVDNSNIGEPPHRNWIAFKSRIRNQFSNECATVCMLLLLHLNHQILDN
jgi:hypothetical protein